MKAITYYKYGSPDVLELEEVEKPTPQNDEVLIKVLAASINDWDWGLLRGKPLVNRLFSPLRPKNRILGTDMAGHVEAVGRNVNRFKLGDEVFGDLSASGFGGFAEYVCASENALVTKPASMSFEQAAAVPHAAALALQALRYKGQIRPGKSVLFNGAGGGAGTFAIQIARSFGLEMTAVDSANKLDALRSLGAQHVIDYKQEDFTRNGRRYDLIIDVKSSRSIFDYRRALNSGGTCVLVGGALPRVFVNTIAGIPSSMIGNKKVGVLLHKPNGELDLFNDLYEDGKVLPVIDRTYPLDRVPDALRHFGEAQQIGKLVITI